MITLKEITEDNFDICVKLEVNETQKNFVANNTRSLAHAWLYNDYAHPFAIYNDNEMVGFIMFHVDKDKKKCFLWRLMVDKNHQGKGYGKEALSKAIEHFRKTLNPNEIGTGVVPGNEYAEKLYKSLGFVFTGEIDDGEHVMALKFNNL